MSLRSAGRPASYERGIGIIRFEMEDDDQVVHCMVSEGALRGRAAMAEDEESDVEALFAKYRREIEKIAALRYARGESHPIVVSADLVRPPPLPPQEAGAEKI